ncbi:MAG: FAD-binding oxidoreductase [Rhodobiaceae bacterium]|nr:FAD-binding oxidoreductase [Rhodobiaceae bacterium]MCC0048600.1 FAD-binding oxidoreductase [Rhodobiaceae bacterium]
MSEVLVLGGGMVGVSTALALQAAGRDVVLVDRKPPGRETSYGNAGVIQSEAAEPYALPLAPSMLLKIAFKQTNDVNYHLSALPSYLRPLLAYFRSSLPARHKALSGVYSKLTRRATEDHAPLIAAAGADNLILRNGLRIIHRSQAAFEASVNDAERMARDYAIALRIETSAELDAAEPHLKPVLAGAIHWPDSWSCVDPGGLTQAYAGLFVSRGGTIALGDANTLEEAGGGWRMTTADGPVTAQDAVIALGPWSPEFLKRFGYTITMLRKRGYHLQFTGGATISAPFLDAETATVISPVREGLRVLTGAELARFDAQPTPVQMQRSTRAAEELLDLGAPVEADAWYGNRPCMPDMLPLAGPAPRHKGLWFHFGHGHQGFTLGPTTANALAETMAGGSAPIPELLPARLRSL